MPSELTVPSATQILSGFPQRLDGPRGMAGGRILEQPGLASRDGRMKRDQVPVASGKGRSDFLGRPCRSAQPTIVGGMVILGGGDREGLRY